LPTGFLWSKAAALCNITGPDVIKACHREEVTHDELGGAIAHATKSARLPFCHGKRYRLHRKNKNTAFLRAGYAAILPCSLADCTDSEERICEELDTIIPDKGKPRYDMKKIIKSVADNAKCFEPFDLWAQNIIVALDCALWEAVWSYAIIPVLPRCADVNACR